MWHIVHEPSASVGPRRVLYISSLPGDAGRLDCQRHLREFPQADGRLVIRQQVEGTVRPNQLVY